MFDLQRLLDGASPEALKKFRAELDTVHGSHVETLGRAAIALLKHDLDVELKPPVQPQVRDAEKN